MRRVCFFSALVCFSSLAPGFPHELVILNPGPEDEEDLIVTKTQQREEGTKKQQGGKFCSREKSTSFSVSAGSSKVSEESCFSLK